MKLKVGDKVRLNKEIKEYKWGRANVRYDEVGFITNVAFNEIIVHFPSHHSWSGLESELVLVREPKHFKSLPSNYTGTIEVENGFIQEKEILDDTEKRYLKAVIRPFKNKVNHISKEDCYDGDCYISIELDDEEDINLPYFKKETMYNGMEEDKRYTLKELGLDV